MTTDYDTAHAVLREMEARGEELIQLCAALVAAASPNPPGDTREAASVLRGYLNGQGIDSEVHVLDPAMPNLIAECRGSRSGKHLVLNVHLDTMPAGDESTWTVAPYRLTERGGRLYGLGMGNMKGAVAAMSLAFAVLARNRELWSGRLTLTAVSDECVFGDNGARFLLDKRAELAGDALLSGEGPGWMRLGIAEKGVAWYELEASGPGGHASRAQPRTSAINRLARVVLELEDLSGASYPPPLRLARAFPDSADAGLSLSINVGTIAGGTYVSQIPIEARADIDVRLPPGLDIVGWEGRLADTIGDLPVTWRRIKAWEANWTAPDSPIVQAVSEAARSIRGQRPQPAIRLPASDASRWRTLGVPAVCFGPQPTLSAGVDDYAERQDILDCMKIYALAALRYLQS